MRCPNYNATKAALHQWILVFREQLKNAGSKVKVVELFPPAVQSTLISSFSRVCAIFFLIQIAELHDKKHQPEIANGRSMGMPLDQFTKEAYQGLAAGKDEVPVGTAIEWYNAGEPQRQAKFHQLAEAMSGK